ncbi:hypothetical protein HOV93_30150 [Planctomycetes bacterium FF15]|uniref:Uncharacterized protein n=1 Tax=Bremerella alba TaxID=980252 RepID=A0A7V8V6F3_9BACT|nr:hypothetical protein [Bremerella alba]
MNLCGIASTFAILYASLLTNLARSPTPEPFKLIRIGGN